MGFMAAIVLAPSPGNDLGAAAGDAEAGSGAGKGVAVARDRLDAERVATGPQRVPVANP